MQDLYACVHCQPEISIIDGIKRHQCSVIATLIECFSLEICLSRLNLIACFSMDDSALTCSVVLSLTYGQVFLTQTDLNPLQVKSKSSLH